MHNVYEFGDEKVTQYLINLMVVQDVMSKSILVSEKKIKASRQCNLDRSWKQNLLKLDKNDKFILSSPTYQNMFLIEEKFAFDS